MKILVLGATGATGRRLVEQLLERGHELKVIVRDKSRLPHAARNNPKVEIIEAAVLNLSEEQMAELLKDCTGAASCLGHNITLKGIFGPPRKLVRDAVQLVCRAAKRNAPKSPFRFVLMNTVGYRNKGGNERYSMLDRLVIAIMRVLVPPQSDNEQAAEYLRTEIGSEHPHIEWVTVRPDTLFIAGSFSTYTLLPSPSDSPVFGNRKTSRINVAHFMAELLTDDDLWRQWSGKFPVIYNDH